MSTQKMIYAELAQEWLNDKQRRVRESSRFAYANIIKMVIRSLKKQGLYDLTIDEWTNEIINNFFAENSHYSFGTLQNFTKVLTQPFQLAVERGYLQKSPYVNIEIESDIEEREIETFSVEEVKKLLRIKCPQWRKDMMFLAFKTGMRVGEIIVLRWEDIFFEEKYIWVRRTLSRYNNKNDYTITEPKTRNGKRKIAVDDSVLEMLKRRKRDAWYDLVFCRTDGNVYSRQSLHMREMCKRAGIPSRSFHAFRHTHATMLLLSNVNPRIVQRRLGHRSLETTELVYGHVPLAMQKRATDVTELLDIAA